MNQRLHAALLALLGGSGLLTGCSTKTDVSLTGNTPAQYSHVWITVQEVWFNGSATAGPDDNGWQKYPLSTPSTVDLVAQNGGNLGGIASGLRVPISTYSQVRLIPVDATAPLAASAQNAGALYNFEADYVDSSGTTQQLPLELLSPDKGIGIQTSLKVPVGSSGGGLVPLGAGSSFTNTTTPFGATTTPFGATTTPFGATTTPFGATTTPFGATTTPFGATTTPFGATTTPFGGTTTTPFGTTTSPFDGTTGFTSPTSTFGATTTPDNSFAVALDGNSDLVPFKYAAGTPGILLSPHDAAYDLSIAGGISGQLSLTNITTSTSGLPDIRVSAQTLSADGTRHIIVSSSAVLADGSFLLYPLPTNSSTNIPLTYDVVIHGPGIATIIIKGVQVPRPIISSTGFTGTTPFGTTAGTTFGTTPGTMFGTTPGTTFGTTPGTLFGTTPGTTFGTTPGTMFGTTPGTTTGTTTGISTLGTANSNVNAVSIGSLTPRAVTAYMANIATAPGAPLPAGAVVSFYQTLGAKGEVPYIIESSPMDPFNQVLFNAQALSPGTVDSGTWSTNGTVTVVSAAPKEGAGTYLVAASAPGFSDGTLSSNVSVSAPQSGTASVVVPALALESGASAGTLLARIVTAVAGKYDQGQLLLSHNGTLVSATPLDAVLGQGTGGIVTVRNLPSGTPDAVYYATVRAWCSGTTQCSSSNNPGAVQRQWYSQAIDLRTSKTGTIDLTVN